MNNILLFKGGGIYFFWYLGLINSIDKNYLKNYKFYGFSGGLIAMVFYLCEINLTSIFKKFSKIEYLNLNYLLNNLDELLNDLLPENSHELCNNKLNIIYWKILEGYKIKNNFESKKELIEYTILTCKLPFTFKNIKQIIKNLSMDPLFVITKNLKITYDNILEIGFRKDNNCCIYDSFYIYTDFKEYMKKYYAGYNYGLDNIIYTENLIKLK